jgi:hypothetical protein
MERGGTMEHKDHHITTDDLAFSAYLKTKGYRLIKSNRQNSRNIFSFEVKSKQDEGLLMMEFINSDFLKYYNELRSLKKLL